MTASNMHASPSTCNPTVWHAHHHTNTRPANLPALVTVRGDDGDEMTDHSDSVLGTCDEPGGEITSWRCASPAQVPDYPRDAEPVDTAGLSLTAGAWMPHSGDRRPVGADAAVEIAAASDETLADLAGRFAWGQSVPVEGRITRWRTVPLSVLLSA